MEAKTLFKKLVHDAIASRELPIECSDTPRTVMSYGSQPREWFHSRKKHVGKYVHLTDEYIDALSDDELEYQMVIFIYTCFQQR